MLPSNNNRQVSVKYAMGTGFFRKILQYLETMPVLGAFTVDDPLVQQQNIVTKFTKICEFFTVQ